MAEPEPREPHEVLNRLPPQEARAALLRCCGSHRWADEMLRRRPYPSADALYSDADQVWGALDRDDFLEAFAHHPVIGGGGAGAANGSLASTRAWSSEEQAGVAGADAETVAALRAANRAYAERFGFIFIVCATGKSAREMLALLQARIDNDPETELGVAAAEQAKITRLRLQKVAR
jgi:2-oxo-4-hydroxy-4-carboxy-5-ureidoimidazoline decarboxylase